MIKKISIPYQYDYVILIFFSFYVNYYYSSLGVLTQDTFAYYDTAYRILNGSAPFRDYWTVSGPFIDYLQAFFFYFLGVSWKSYILSGSIINSIITIIFFSLIKNFDVSRSLSFFYAICFSVLANPSMGVPFPDHYSTFLSLLGIFFFLLALKKNNHFFWLAIPVCFFFGFFSKQSPSSYIFIILLISTTMYIYYERKIFFLKYYVTSTILCLLILYIFFSYYQINLDQFLNQYIFFPQSIAEDRMKNYQLNFNSLFAQFKFIYLFLIPLIFLTFQRYKEKNFHKSYKFLFCVIIILLCLVLIFHQLLTRNFVFIFFLIPILASVIEINFTESFRYKKIISIFLISATLFLTMKYHYRFNESRKMLNLENINLNNTVDSEQIHSSLKGLNWITYKHFNDPKFEVGIIKDSIKIIENDKSKKMILTEYLFLSSILNQDLNNPTRWPSSQDASNPNKKNQYYEYYKKFVEDLIKIKKIETLYSIKDNENDIFSDIFDKKCKKVKEINDFLTKHDIKNCFK